MRDRAEVTTWGPQLCQAWKVCVKPQRDQAGGPGGWHEHLAPRPETSMLPEHGATLLGSKLPIIQGASVQSL